MVEKAVLVFLEITTTIQSHQHKRRNASSLPCHDTISNHHLSDVGISLTLNNSSDELTSNTWVLGPHLGCFLWTHTTKIRCQHTRSKSPYLDLVLFQFVIPVHHEHVQGTLAASITDGFE